MLGRLAAAVLAAPRTIRDAWSGAGWTTRGLLLAYALYVPAAWIFGTAPGEIAYEGHQRVPLPEALAEATAVHRADDDVLVLELGTPPQTLAVLRPSHAEPLDAAIVARVPAPGSVHSAVVREGILQLLTEDDEGARHLLRVPLDGRDATTTPTDPSALWPLPDGTALGHGLVDFLTTEHWGLHPAGRPGLVSGPLLLLRMAQGQPDPDGTWSSRPDATDEDFMLLDSDDAEPRRWLDTVKLFDVSPAPAVPGFLYLPQGFPSLAWCDEDGCHDDMVHIRTDRHPIRHLDHCELANRIAACTPDTLYLYEGDPREEAVVFLGRAALPGDCTSLAIVDATSVLVTFADQPAVLVRLTEDADG